MSYNIAQLTPALWVGQSRLYQTNSGVFLSAGQALLIDPAIFPDEIKASGAFVAAYGAELAGIVLTHIHWDHILGPEHFPGAPTLAQRKYAELASTHAEQILADVANFEHEHNVSRSTPFTIPPATQLFADTMDLAVGDLHLRLAFAPGHAYDMLVVFQPETGLLWAADILSDIEIPSVCDTLANYDRTLAMLSTWDIHTIVPGHGSPTSDAAEIAARLSDDKAYLAELRGRIEQALREGKDLAEAEAACASMSFRLPDENSGFHRFNIGQVYAELKRETT